MFKSSLAVDFSSYISLLSSHQHTILYTNFLVHSQSKNSAAATLNLLDHFGRSEPPSQESTEITTEYVKEGRQKHKEMVTTHWFFAVLGFSTFFI